MVRRVKHAVVIEKAEGNYSAYVPGLPGCVETGASVVEVEQEIREAIAFHIEGPREDGLAISAGSSAYADFPPESSLVSTSPRSARPSFAGGHRNEKQVHQ